MTNTTNMLDNKIEKCAAQIRVCNADIKTNTKFLKKKNEDAQKLQEIVSSFKDRLMEKYAVLADEYTENFKRIEQKQLSNFDMIAKIERNQ